MKRYIRQLYLILVLILAGSFSLQAKADVIVTPNPPQVLESECTPVECIFAANGPDGIISVYDYPDPYWRNGRIENGKGIYIYYAYTDYSDVRWGYFENRGGKPNGWVRMDDLLQISDADSFEKTFGHEIQDEKGYFEDVYSGDIARFHEFPGSSAFRDASVKEWNDGAGAVTYSKVYLDSSGCKWVMVDKANSDLQDAWVNLGHAPEQADGESDDETDVTKETEIRPQPGKEDPRDRNWLVFTIALWIVALVAVTCVLLLYIKRKR